jgi:ABC-type glycerol-3-phosphate transport system substrate-binding protein
MMKKGLFLLGIFAMFIGIGCSGKSNASTSTAAEAVTVWTAFDDAEASIHNEIFKKLYPDVNINIAPYPAEDLKTQTRLAVDSGTTPDIFMLNAGTLFQDYYRAGGLADITDIVNNDNLLTRINPDYIKPYTVNGRYYAFPAAPLTTWQSFYVNRDLFAKAGITKDPANMTELLGAAAKLKTAGIAPIALGDKDGWPAIILMGDFFAQQVENMAIINAINSGREKFTTNPELRRAFEGVVTLGKAGAYMTGFISQDHTAAIQTFAAGQAAMLYNGSWWTGVAGTTDPGFALDVISLPLLDGLTEGKAVQMSSDMAFAVNPASVNKDGVKKFIDYITTEEASIVRAEAASGFSIYPGANTKVKFDPLFQKEPILKQFDKPSLAPFFDWVFPTPVTELLKIVIQQAIMGTITVDEALIQLQAEMDKNVNTMNLIPE